MGIVPDSTEIRQRLPIQMEWANHMGIPAVILPPIPRQATAATDYAQLVSSMALKSSATNGQVWIQTYVTEESMSAFETLHRQCDGASNVGMMLCFDSSVHSTNPLAATNPTAAVAAQMIIVHKAIGAQLKAVSFATSTFLTNKRGYPALSKTHQVLFTEILRRVGRSIRVQVEGPSNHRVGGPDIAGVTSCLPYLQYIRHIRARAEIQHCLDTEAANLEEPYLDHLQRPLQPLGDHLEFSTYETFEKDNVKYKEYQKAIALAMRDNLGGIHNRDIVILVAGAGRGPLVSAALKAIESSINVHSSVRFILFAVEKNPSAIVYLESLKRHEASWKGRVNIIKSDMRSLKKSMLGNKQADLVVSELLGSFGDNELSPECIDTLYATGILKETTVCIPSSYTAYLAPVSSFRLHVEARAQSYFPSSTSDGLDSSPLGTLKAIETPYVVRSHAACQTHIEQGCWKFSHPATSQSRERTAHVEFRPDVTHGSGCGSGYGPYDQAVATMAQATMSGTSGSIAIHGFLGTFSAILYSSPQDDAEVTLSTRPTNYTRNMFSWFPLYFPLRDPLHIPKGGTIVASIWRKCAEDRVWYEWCGRVTQDGNTVGASAIHNPNGRSYHVSL